MKQHVGYKDRFKLNYMEVASQVEKVDDCCFQNAKQAIMVSVQCMYGLLAQAEDDETLKVLDEDTMQIWTTSHTHLMKQ